MKKQVVIIHGGDAYTSYERYIESLKGEELDIQDLRQDNNMWRRTLGSNLGPDFEVIAPKMPCQQNAKYAEWKIWFDKLVPQLNDEVILIGHSLGGIFLAKYLSENKFPKKIRATFLVAPPYDDGTDGDPIADFSLTERLNLFAEQGGEIRIYHSSDDQIVDDSDLKAYQKALPMAKPVLFSDKGHFIIKEFPEIVKDIRDIFAS